jgi:hypothetical protein
VQDVSAITLVTGSQCLFAWFGYWPTFHDAELLRLDLNRAGGSTLSVLTWEISADKDPSGKYILQKHVVANFSFDEIYDSNLVGFSNQNVIGSLDVAVTERGLRMIISQIYGLAGMIEARRISVELLPIDSFSDARTDC